MASSPQPRDRLGERRGRNNALSTYMWKEKARREEKGNKESGKGQGQRNWCLKGFGDGRRYSGKRSQKKCQYEKPGTMP